MEDIDLAEHFDKSFRLSQEKWTIGKILDRMENDIDIDGSRIGCFETRGNFYALGLDKGFLTIEEIRKLERLPNMNQREKTYHQYTPSTPYQQKANATYVRYDDDHDDDKPF